MRRPGLTLVACLLSPLALAATPHWLPVAHSADHRMQVTLDSNSVRPRDGRISAWVQYNYVAAQRTLDPEPKNYRSSLSLEAFDCAADRSGTMSMNFYSAPNGRGKLVSTGSITPQDVQFDYFPPGSVGEEIMVAACRLAQQGIRSPLVSTPTPGSGNRPSPAFRDPAPRSEMRYYKTSDRTLGLRATGGPTAD